MQKRPFCVFEPPFGV